MALNKAIEIIKLEIAERRVKSKNPLTRSFTMDEEIESLEEALSILSFNPLSVNVFGLEPEIREIDGVSYSVQKVPCTCSCHRTGAVHFAPCCNNGYKEILRKIE